MPDRPIRGALLLGAISLLLATSAKAKLAGWWMFDEGGGPGVADSSGSGHNGTVTGNLKWAGGKLGGALQFDGTSTYVNCGVIQIATQGTGALSVCAWVNRTVAGDNKVCGNRQVVNTAGGGFICAVYNNRMEMDLEDGAGRLLSRDAARPTIPGVNTWVHLAWVYNDAANTLELYVDGVLKTTATVTQGIGLSTQAFYIGTETPTTGHWFNGLIDDLRLYDHALSETEISDAMIGLGPVDQQASVAAPADKATDVPRDAVLGWKAGTFAATHDVYLGTTLVDVDTATRAQPLGVLVSQGQDAAAYDPSGLLAFGRTYYWRVDEVNAVSAGSTVFKGDVWSFTTEPYAYPVKAVAATASSSHNATMGPEKTIDGSGLNASDQHSTAPADMWLSSKSGPKPAWIQYEFDRVYKLHQMWVWNSNQSVESTVGFGAKDVTVEYSTDGLAWTALPGMHEFAQASGTADYTHNTTIDLQGAVARYVRLTITTNWGGMLPQFGLGEVRFFYVPVQAFEPGPGPASTGVALDASLQWRPGREAASHQLYLSADAGAVTQGTALVGTFAEHRASLGSLGLDYGRTYYWKVNEVNDASHPEPGYPKTWEGDLWSFTTIGYAVVDDFEAYDDTCNRIFFAWVDGFGHNGSPDCSVPASPGNGTQSTVGNISAPFAERTIVNSGSQSMPMAYDNTKTPFYSETQREWSTPQAWTSGGVNTLTVTFRGEAPAFLETSPGSIVMTGTGTDIYGTVDQGRFAYKSLSGDGSIVARVESLANTNAWAKAGVMIRETLNESSSWAYIVYGGTNGVHYQARLTTNVTATSDTTLTTLPADQTGARSPVWVKVERKGNQFNGYYATDAAGAAWKPMAWNPQTITMAANVYIGLAVTSHAANVVCGGRFSSVATTGNVTGAWQTADLGVVQPAAGTGNSPETFYVAVQDSSGKIKVVGHPDPVAIASGAWQQWDIPFGDLTSAGVNLGSVKKMIVGVGNRTSPKPGSAGKVCVDDIRLARK